MTSIRRLPNMSPSRPKSGVQDRGREQVAGERPRDAARVGVERARELADRRDQGRLRRARTQRGRARMSRLRQRMRPLDGAGVTVWGPFGGGRNGPGSPYRSAR